MAKNLADRYANLNSQMDNVIKDANSEISGLRDRLESKTDNHASAYGLQN
jgi:E3 ubiquitin-protein ligase CCNP1IP1